MGVRKRGRTLGDSEGETFIANGAVLDVTGAFAVNDDANDNDADAAGDDEGGLNVMVESLLRSETGGAADGHCVSTSISLICGSSPSPTSSLSTACALTIGATGTSSPNCGGSCCC